MLQHPLCPHPPPSCLPDLVSTLHACIGNVEDRNVPTLVEALVRHKMVDVDCGSDDAHTLALEANGRQTPRSCDSHVTCFWLHAGTVWAWGDGGLGKLGQGSFETFKTPKAVSSLKGVVSVKCGTQFSVALTAEGRVYTW